MNNANEFKNGDTAYLVESNRFIREVTVVKCSAGFCLVKYGPRGECAIRVRVSRLFRTKEDATASIKSRKV